jgi:hypothetical protein
MIMIKITIRSSYPKVGPVSAQSNPVEPDFLLSGGRKEHVLRGRDYD